MVPDSHLWELEGRFTDEQSPRPVARGKVVGGSSAVNGQVFLRGLPEDFAAWVDAGAAGWTFEEMLPAFRRIEADADFVDRWHGSEGPIPVRRYPRADWLPPQAAFHEAGRAAGFPEFDDANRPDATGVGPLPFNNLDGIRQSVALTHLSRARGRPNLTIRARCQAIRLRHQGRVVKGLEVLCGAQAEVIVAAHYVLCAGSVGSPLLLLLSGIGPAEELRRAGVSPRLDLPVGRNLRDHAVVDLTWEAEAGAWTPAPSAPLLQVVLSYTAAGSRHRNDMKLTARSRLMSADRERTRGVLTVVPGLYRPLGDGELRLRSADPLGQPEIRFRFLEEPDDRARLRDAVRLALDLAGHAALRPWTARRLAPPPDAIESDHALEAWLLRTVRNSQHPCGTCRMGQESDERSVVDPEGRVIGLDNLRVVDASIFPDAVRAHINATTIAVAERLAGILEKVV